jgi:hypothetical protein
MVISVTTWNPGVNDFAAGRIFQVQHYGALGVGCCALPMISGRVLFLPRPGQRGCAQRASIDVGLPGANVLRGVNTFTGPAEWLGGLSKGGRRGFLENVPVTTPVDFALCFASTMKGVRIIATKAKQIENSSICDTPLAGANPRKSGPMYKK